MIIFPYTASNEFKDQWCAYSINTPSVAEDLYINAAPLTEVFHLTDLRNNSDWQSIVAANPSILIRVVILAIGPKVEMMNAAFRAARELQPRCNKHGFDVSLQQRRIICSNGETYDTQAQAAVACKISQSQLSLHLAGRCKHVKGLTFTWERL